MKAEGKRKKGDLIIILVVLLIGVGAAMPWLWNQVNPGEKSTGREHIAVITRDGKEVARINLASVTEPQHFHYEDGIELTIVAENGTIRFLESQCPDQICVRSGVLSKPGDFAACLPAGTIVTIEGDEYE
ncbi:MAG TPA: NusG domain II-containing protein [Desulfitobacterium dehalogenans]|uniref:NusG domain II-containing protein n=1 Tax=Desulfitobacterium dehalogenans TaxID=36854 RepID=A0A7C7D4C8_9FIRM|nr:NusG domain II-containing protein [Desulfitobacterium dehalogenans]